MLNKKIRKLVKNPKLFFSDMSLKRSQQLSVLKPKKNIGNNKFTVVSAVYNVDKYLDKYFESLVNQRLDFKNNIQLVLVDDGSPDNSAKIIKLWQEKYPDNITYVKKENGGQASARNFGLDFVKTEWVTFIDPDDFVDIDYFLSAENFINKNNNIGLLSCNFIFYFEDLEQFKDTHPLKYRFNKGDRVINADDLKKDVQLSVNSAIFKSKIISDNNVLFGEDIKPNFEDAHFVSMYLMYLSKEKVAFLKSAQYFYRKRSDGSSTLDKAWEKPTLYNVVLDKGCLNLLRSYKENKGFIPESVQITNLYHLIWYFKKLINNKHKLKFLSEVEKEEFIQLVSEIFTYIDTKTIMEFSLADCWFFHKVGLLGAFKNQEPVNQIVYIDSYDRVKGLTQLRFFSYSLPDIVIKSGETIILPYYEKEIHHEFVGNIFVREFRLWVNIKPTEKINIKINNKAAAITCGGKQHKEGLTGQSIINYFKGLVPDYVVENEHSGAWVFMDRDFQADDNAEHLYRYVMQEHPERDIYYALNSDSHDWQRLESEGFHLLAFGSEQHHDILKSCSKIISSNADHCVVNLLGPKMLAGRHFVFLQHGVIHNDLSAWLNQKENIDCFVTSSPFEYDSIAGNGSKYKYSEKEVVLTGLPRHDYLVKNNVQPEKIILVMPTWRADIVGKSDLSGHSRSVNDSFLETEFARCWLSLLRSEHFKDVLEKHNYKVIIYPHPNLIPYIDYFRVSDGIEVLTPNNTRIQDVFCRSAMLLTDYTSVAFDMAVQNKPTLYYQFDEYEVLHSGKHTFSPGYFEHRRDGFGPICNTQDEVLFSLDYLLGNNCVLDVDVDVAERINKTFPLRDGYCCERTYNAIIELDSPTLPEIPADRLIQQAMQMTIDENWATAESWWKALMLRDDIWSNPKWYSYILEQSCLRILEERYDSEGIVPVNMQETVLYHVFGYIKHLMDKTYLLQWMDGSSKNDFLTIVENIFRYIDKSTILKFSREGCWFLHKFGMLNAFKNSYPDSQIVYVDSYDHIKGLVQLRYFVQDDEFESIQVGGRYTLPVYEKIIRHDFFGRKFALEKRVWVEIRAKDKLVAKISTLPTVISYGGKQYKTGTTGQEIISYFENQIPKYVKRTDDSKIWMFMDCDYQANGNAEYLYRYVKQMHPDKNIYYVLDKDSPDWSRLEQEGFRLLEFGSTWHHEMLKSCDKVISSSVARNVTNLLGAKMLTGRHFVYLQQNVSKLDLSNILNVKDNIDCYITSTSDEYNSIIDEQSYCKYSSKEVVLTGLPKHDYLIDNNHIEDLILIIPTGPVGVLNDMRDIFPQEDVNHSNKQLIENININKWIDLLSSEQMALILQQYGYHAIVYLHDDLIQYAHLFKNINNIELYTSCDRNIQYLLCRSAMLLTDYSSNDFDMAVQMKPTVYYHIDGEQALPPLSYIGSKDSFDYEKNGFGPVCTDKEHVLNALGDTLHNKCIPDSILTSKISATLPFRDGRCCERIFDAIEALDHCSVPNIETTRMIAQAVRMTHEKQWAAAESWWRSLAQRDDVWYESEWYSSLLEETCLEILQQHHESEGKVPEPVQATVLYHIFLYIRHLLDNSHQYSVMDDAGRCDSFLGLVDRIFSYIDDKTILKFAREGSWFLHKFGMLNAFKNSLPDSQIIYIDSYDNVKSMVQLRYFIHGEESENFLVGGNYVLPIYEKIMRHDILGRDFVYEKRVWLAIDAVDKLVVKTDKIPTVLSYGGKQYKDGVTGLNIASYFNGLISSDIKIDKKPDSWMFIDREDKAGDNAEHLYHYIMRECKDIDIYFALNRNSNDWDRLKKDGFNLVPFGSQRHREVLKTCSKVVSSQVESYVAELLGSNITLGKHFVYLQSRLGFDDAARVQYNKSNIDCFITSTPYEYSSVANDGGVYKYSGKEVVLTGTPMLDALVNNNIQTGNVLLIIPEFSEADVELSKHSRWLDLINSPEFMRLLRHHGYMVALYADKEQAEYFSNISTCDYLNIIISDEANYEDVLSGARILLTDYSRATFDMAAINKPTIYYQFSEDDIGSIKNSYLTSGYFSSCQEGFGPICNNIDDLIHNIDVYLQRNGELEPNTIDIINRTFMYRDGKCCERILQAIEKLDVPSYPEVSIKTVIAHTIKNTNIDTWKISAAWWKQILQHEQCWDTSSVYTDILEYSYLKLLRDMSDKKSHIPEEVQNTILKNVFCYIKKIINEPKEIESLHIDEYKNCWLLIKEIFSYIDTRIIMKFSDQGYWFLHKVGILGTFKDISPESQIIYIEGVDSVKELVQVRYFTCSDVPLLINVNGKYTYPIHVKDTHHVFMGQSFVNEKRAWIKLPEDGAIHIGSSDLPAVISIGGHQHKDAVSGGVIYSYFQRQRPRYQSESDYSDTWLFMDSNIQAGGDAECLYRYVMRHYPEKNIYFVINQNSYDWSRLEQDGFRLLAFGSDKHKDVLKTCSKVISSHIERYVTNLLGPKMLYGRHFIWLQNNVDKRNTPQFLNGKDNIDCLIVSTCSEYESLMATDGQYKYSDKEIVLAGMPRFDSLVSDSSSCEDLILIMPNWQRIEEVISHGLNSDFINEWLEIVRSSVLSEIIVNNGVKAVFYIQPESLWNSDLFSMPDYIDVLTPENKNIQSILRRAKILLTDDSDIAIDMAIQNKSTIYLQPNNYSYSRKEFGIICSDIGSLHDQISFIFSNQNSMCEGLTYFNSSDINVRDGKCCERIVDAIHRLDNPECEVYATINDKIEMASWFCQQQKWSVAAKIWGEVILEDSSLEYQIRYIEALLKIGDIVEISNISESIDIHDLFVCRYEDILVISKSYFLLGEYQKVVESLQRYETDLLPGYYYISLQILGNQNHDSLDVLDCELCNSFVYIKSLLDNKDYECSLCYLNDESHTIDPSLRNALVNETLYKSKNYEELHHRLSGYRVKNINSHISEMYFDVLLHKQSYEEIISYEKLIPLCSVEDKSRFCNEVVRYAFAESFFQLKQWDSAIYYFNDIKSSFFNFAYKFALAYRMIGELDQSLYVLTCNIATVGSSKVSKECWLLWIEIAQLRGNWDEVVIGWNNIITYFSDDLPHDAWTSLKNARLMSNLGNLDDLSDAHKTLLLLSMTK